MIDLANAHQIGDSLRCPVYITRHAMERYAFARRYAAPDYERAHEEMLEALSHASLRARDSVGRELWRMRPLPKLRFVLCYLEHHSQLPQVVWCGLSAPPERFWTPGQDPTYPRTRTERSR